MTMTAQTSAVADRPSSTSTEFFTTETSAVTNVTTATTDLVTTTPDATTPTTIPITIQTTEPANTTAEPAATSKTTPITTPPTTSTTTPITTPKTTPTTTPQVSSVTMILRLDRSFDVNLQNSESPQYKDLVKKVVNALTKSYQNVPGFIKVTVTGFRAGSVIVDFQVELDYPVNSEIIKQLNENPNISSNLKNEGLSLMEVAQSKKVLGPNTKVYPEQPMILNCTPDQQDPGTIKWKIKGTEIQPDTRYNFSRDNRTLTVNSATIADNGRYECGYNSSTGQYILWEEIDYIEPYPNIQMTPNRTNICQKTTVPLRCCVFKDYNIQLWKNNTFITNITATDSLQKCIEYQYVGICGSYVEFVCNLTDSNLNNFSYSSNTMHVKISEAKPTEPPTNQRKPCNNDQFGYGDHGTVTSGQCKNKDEVGSQTVMCNNGNWEVIDNNCVLRVFQVLKEQSQGLDINNVKPFVEEVTQTTKNHTNDVISSTANIATIITLLNSIANVSKNVTIDENVIKVNNISNFATSTNTITFTKATIIDQPFNETFGNHSEASLFIPSTNLTKNLTITALAFFSLSNILPSRNTSVNDTTVNTISGIIVMVSPSQNESDVTFKFKKLLTQKNSKTLANPECVFWNFSLYNNIGGWDSYGCKLTEDFPGNVTCECNHTTSFSILMSPLNEDSLSLTIITYVGLSVSVLSLVVFLLIEIIFWKPLTSSQTNSPMLYLRHVSMVNIALSLLIADIWLIAGVTDKLETNPACHAVIFFIHFFYLAVFFWMLVSAILLLYSVIVVFTNMSKTSLMAISFSVGYGAPLIIAVITVASTAGRGKYIRKDACWLQWDDSRALLAFAFPVLAIVFTNFVVMIVVLYKMLKKRVGERTSDEKNSMAVIARFVAVLTPILGLTWGFGLGTITSPGTVELHYLFAILNSLQGFFITVFGFLFDKKISKTIRQKLSTRLRSSGAFSSTQRTRSSNPTSSTGII
ncbi:adhesion G-protein coupled receptor F1-like [Astyanax mexicanus]|uniref:Adhesion G-protein coupled receptor F1-like n=1 Tax=Astyanax mexicanus TaxID=7994 RepID=A0A8T2LP75_ASTMX|nr:adhesion G-protein coupled receptor F1-like [Astyanax mexicanus]